MSETDRSEFEAFMRDCECPPHKISTVEGKYIWPLVADHYHTWLAARKGMVPADDVLALCEAVKQEKIAWGGIGREAKHDHYNKQKQVFALAAALKQKIKEQDDES